MADKFQKDGWCYDTPQHEEGADARRLVTLVERGSMQWIGLRAWHEQEGRWYNGNEPELHHVLAWRHLPEIAQGFWDRGKLVIAS